MNITKVFLNQVTAKMLATLKTTLNNSQGSAIEIHLLPRFTKYNIKQILYAQRSKKARSDEIRVRDGGNLHYRYVGTIIKLNLKHNKLNSTTLFRNVLSLVSFEINFQLFSPMVKKFHIFNQKRFSKNKRYYLRKKSRKISKINFDYIINE